MLVAALLHAPQLYRHCSSPLSHLHELVFDQALQVAPLSFDVRICNAPVLDCRLVVADCNWVVMERC